MERNEEEKLYANKYLEKKIKLESRIHLELTCEFEKIKGICESIGYVNEMQTEENGKYIREDKITTIHKLRYYNYYRACKTSNYLADYAIRIIKELEEQFEDISDCKFQDMSK